MWWKLKNYAVVICLFVFLFVVIGNGLHLTPIASFTAAVSGTPLAVFAFNRWHKAQGHGEDGRAASGITREREGR